MKPLLPPEIMRKFPHEIVHLIYSFLPNEPTTPPWRPNESYTRAVEALTKMPLQGISPLSFRGLGPQTEKTLPLDRIPFKTKAKAKARAKAKKENEKDKARANRIKPNMFLQADNDP